MRNACDCVLEPCTDHLCPHSLFLFRVFDHHDLLLVTIPALLALGVVVSVHPAVALHEGMAAGSLASTVLLYNALFRNPPVEPATTDVAAGSVVTMGWLTTILLYL